MKTYDYVCKKYKESLRYECQRYSNNDSPTFTDQEIMTIYIFAMNHQKLFKIQDIHRYAKNHLTSWFPNLNSYQAFNNRLNRLCAVMGKLVEFLIEEFKPYDCSQEHSLLDSMPIILCSGKRQGNRRAHPSKSSSSPLSGGELPPGARGGGPEPLPGHPARPPGLDPGGPRVAPA